MEDMTGPNWQPLGAKHFNCFPLGGTKRSRCSGLTAHTVRRSPAALPRTSQPRFWAKGNAGKELMETTSWTWDGWVVGGEDGWGTRGDCAGRIVDWVAGPQRPLVARALRLFSAREFCHLKFHYLLRKGAWGVPSLGGAKKKGVQEFSPFPRLTNSVSTSCRTHVTVTFYAHLRQVLTMNKQMNIIKYNERTK